VRDAGKLLAAFGAVLVLLGLALWAAPAIPWLGRLPGDIRIERPGFRLYLPLATSVLASVVLSLVLFIVARLR
jgi:hypothetical protein